MGKKTCFVIAPIGDKDSEIRKRSDQVLEYIIKLVTKECGYKAIRADEISKPGIITTQVIQHLIDDEMVIADLTNKNPNVLYELAIRHAVRKPVVQMIQQDEKIPFDVAPQRTIYYDIDLESANKCKEKLIKQIYAAEKKPEIVDSPLSTAIDLKALRQSEKPWEKSTAEILSMLQNIWGAVQGSNFLKRKEVIFSPGIGDIENFFVDFTQDIVPKLSKNEIIHFKKILSRLLLKIRTSETEYVFPSHALRFCIDTMEKRLLMEFEKETN